MMKSLKNNFTLNLYLKLMPAQILSSLSASLSTFISVTIVGNCLNSNALATVNVAGSFTDIIKVFTILVSSGVIFLVNRAICSKNDSEKESAFSSALLFSLIAGGIVSLLCLLAPQSLTGILGCTEEMVPDFIKYFKGISFGYVLIILSSLLNVIFQIHSDTKKTIYSSIILVTVNVLLSVLFLYILKLDVFYAGLAVTLSQLASFVYLLVCYIRKKYIRFSFKQISLKTLSGLLIYGFTQSFVIIASSFKNLYIKNIMTSLAGGVRALSTMATISAVDSVSYGLFAPAFLMVTMMVSSIFINEKDREGLKKYTASCFKITLALASALWVFMFFSSYFTSKLFNVEYPGYASQAQRIFSFAFFGYLTNMVLIKLFGNLEKVKAVNVLSIISGLIIPSVATTVMVKLFGDTGLWVSFIVGDLGSLLCTVIYIIIHNRRIPRSADEWLCLDDDFGVPEENTICFRISDQNQVEETYGKIIEFCNAKGISSKTAMQCGLCFEEIGTNIVTHGFSKNTAINASVIYEDGRIKMIVRDNCRPFDPNKRFSQLDKNDPFKGIGIRIIMGIADKVEYKSIYGLNILSIYL